MEWITETWDNFVLWIQELWNTQILPNWILFVLILILVILTVLLLVFSARNDKESRGNRRLSRKSPPRIRF
ncbi:hypothetical protein JV173_03345 [Acholeplasma equirhinis]|uniref:hypothetical protein n=1 Tax=Acholeplasma equirhinis TaxID=555393 RepID=UPI00197ACFF1|nr:hypothetical protein [Acholeplasma equirhinis]MBN3490544.1 hypothetical protein [Acholeplasma equirhinis]